MVTEKSLGQISGLWGNVQNGNPLERGQAICSRSWVSCAGFLKHGLRNEEVKAVPALPPIASKLLMCDAYHVATCPCGQVADDRGLNVNFGLLVHVSSIIAQRGRPAAVGRTRSIVKTKIIASDLLVRAVQRHRIHLTLLVADTGLWVSPEFHHRLARDTGAVAMFPKVRRARKGERRSQFLDGVRLDDNRYANVAIKRALGLGKGRAKGFEACHIWPMRN